MKAILSVATTQVRFGDFIRKSLRGTGSFHVYMAIDKAEAILSAEKKNFIMALLDKEEILDTGRPKNA